MWQVRHFAIGSIVMLCVAIIGAQDPKNDEQKPAAGGSVSVATEFAIRIQPMDPDEKGHWIAMPGYDELGSPCFSRDGRWVAFDAYKDGYNNSRPEAWIARRDGTGLKMLTNGATPRWSPDGKRLLVVRRIENEPNHQPDIYVINSDGTGERKLGPGRWPDWSPDGRRIVFSHGGLARGGARVGAEIRICDSDGTGEKVIAEGDCPSWSPDGQRIAFCFKEREGQPRLCLVDLQTNETKTLRIGWFRANWMPDGKTLVANGFAGRLVMVKFAVEGTAPSGQLFSQFEDASAPCPSSDGKYLVFVAKRPKKERGP
jgi:dipeptidyl aminopeptidase/acylaminoacyl peptidase